jgi:hypothetical protein
MATQLLATADTAADSADVTVAAGVPVTIGLKGAAAGARVLLKLKDDADAYNVIGELNGNAGERALTIYGPGVYRLTRVAGASCGVFSA